MSFQIDFPAQPRFPILAPDGTISAPSYSFASQTNKGIMNNSGGSLGFVISGGVRCQAYNGGFDVLSDTGMLRLGNSNDVVVIRDAANTLAMRNGVNAQTFNLYGTYTDASNYERFYATFSGGVYFIGTAAAGTGTRRGVYLTGNTVTIASLNGSTTAVWNFTGSGHFTTQVDNTYDIGASGANRPRSIYAATIVSAPTLNATGYNVQMGDRGYLGASADGVFSLYNAAYNNFTRLQFGGTTSSFPALARSGAGIVCQLADGSARAVFECAAFGSSSTITASSSITAYNATAIPAGGTAGSGFRFSSTTNFGVFFGSGAPTLSAAKGSLYLRSDGSTTNDRMYVNTDGSTAWTAVTTAT